MEKGKRTNFFNMVCVFLSVLAVTLILVGWISFAALNPRLMPGPAEVIERLIRTFTKPIANTILFGHIWASLRRVLIGLIFAWLVGIGLGILIGWNKKVKAVLGSVLEILRPIPPIAWIPLVIMWFGIGEFSKVFIVFIGTIFGLIVNTSAGIRLVDSINVDVGRVFQGNQRQILMDIVVPTALPSIFAGIRTSVSSGWTTVVAAEMLGAKLGLGSLVTKGWQGNDMALVLVAVISIAAIGALLSTVLSRLEKVVCPWNNI
ncbi:ABC transporter permease [Lachnospiraceae bacterium oral taxon 500]|nr:ABC transporter permease [Lachnospiraceae bacterium oral taxon 500]